MIIDADRNINIIRSNNLETNPNHILMKAPTSTFMGYPCAPGGTISIVPGLNGMYAAAISENIKISNITINQVFKNVRATVMIKSEGKQITWDNSSLAEGFYFNH